MNNIQKQSILLKTFIWCICSWFYQKWALKDWQNHILRVFCHWKVSMNYPKMGKNHKFSLKLLVKSVTTGGISTIEIIKCLISNWFFHTYIIFSHFWHFTLGKKSGKMTLPLLKKIPLTPLDCNPVISTNIFWSNFQSYIFSVYVELCVLRNIKPG